jgi:hypothetical protein
MINLCNSSSYSNDREGENLSKRTPRANEDIEIIGEIDQDITINLFELQGSCRLGNISSLTLPFKTDRAYIFTVAGNGSILDPSNPRAPTGTELETINRKNPLRALHGWYTMSTGYGISVLTTNSDVTLRNIAFTNSSTNATNISLETSAYSNGILNVNNIFLQNTSYLYGTTIECSGITLDTNSKCDTINITSNSFTLNNSSIAESQFFGSGFLATDSNVVDCEIQCENLQITNGNFQSRFDYAGSSSNPDIRFTNSIIYNNSQINSKYLYLTNTQISGGTIKADSIEFLQGTIINRDAVVDAEVISLSGLTNEGILTFNSFSGLQTPVLINNGNININNTGTIDIVITNNGKLQLNASGNFISGINNKTIGGTNTILKGSFINGISGIISSPAIKFCDSSINQGSIDVADVTFINNSQNAGFFNKATFLDSSFNIGSGDTAVFSGQNVTNNGSIRTGKFLSSNNNGEVIDLIIYSGINFGRGDRITLYSSTNSGQYPNFNAYGASIYNTNYPIKSGNFYDTSICNLIVGSGQSGEINFYNSGTLNGIASNLTVHFFDNSRGRGTINTTGIFHDNSIFTVGNINYAIFQDMSRNEGNISRGALFTDNSINIGNLGPGLITATFNKAKNYGNIYGASVYLNEAAINFGTISTLYFTGNDSINSGIVSVSQLRSTLSNFINHGTLSGTFDFTNNSINYGTITGSGTFDSTSVNYGTITEAPG